MLRLCLVALALLGLAPALRADGPSRVIISVKDQKLMLMGNGARLATYPISTSKFGVGDAWGHMTTPLGFLRSRKRLAITRRSAPSFAIAGSRVKFSSRMRRAAIRSSRGSFG